MSTDDCSLASGPKLLTLEQAWKTIQSRIVPLSGYEQVILKNCPGRILFDDLHSPLNIPQDCNSSMDGYAFNSSDLQSTDVSHFTIVGTSWAGRPYSSSVGNGECVRIFTGAILPDNTDSVIIQENVVRQGAIAEIPANSRIKNNVRSPGGEIHQGQLVLKKGKRLSPVDMGILASLGISETRVYRKPRVAFFSTGDELIGLDRQPRAGQIYDSNRYTLYGMLLALGTDPLDMGVVRDDRDAILDALQRASSISDVIITSGGVSVGEADLVTIALEAAGQIEFWKIAMKPGKPLAFGQIGDTYFFGLPGNPVSTVVTFHQIVRRALLHLMGTDSKKGLRLQARCVSKITKTAGRQEFQRGSLYTDEQGITKVIAADQQQSHNLHAVSQSNCFIILPAECEGVDAGSPVEVELIDSPFHYN